MLYCVILFRLLSRTCAETSAATNPRYVRYGFDLEVAKVDKPHSLVSTSFGHLHAAHVCWWCLAISLK